MEGADLEDSKVATELLEALDWGWVLGVGVETKI
jgi:hypothetical protein